MRDRRLLFIFVDGVGIGAPDPDSNPFLVADLPVLSDLLGGVPTLDEPRCEGRGGISFPLDATLGVEGRPQSGTGQYSLLTGENGAAALGRHFGPWTPTALRESLQERSLFQTALDQGRAVTFANAHPKGYTSSRWFRRPAPVPFAADAAGLLTRDWDDLAEGRALASSIDNARVRERYRPSMRPMRAQDAGRTLASLAEGQDLTVFAHYDTDTAGHRGDLDASVAALELLDRFLGGVFDAAGTDTDVFMASDHGNIESVEQGHTTNPALGLWLSKVADSGPDQTVASITDVAPWVMGRLGRE